MAVKWTTTIRCACFVGTLLLGGFPSAADVITEEAPADLALEQVEFDRARALAHYAWGLFRQIQGSRPDDYLAHFRQALELHPNSLEIFERLVAPWVVHGEHEQIIETLTPLAAEHPEVRHIQVALAESLMAADRVEDAAEHLLHVLETTGWQDPVYLRMLFACHWRLERYDEVERLLEVVREKPGLTDHAVVAHAAAVFYAARYHTAKDEQSLTEEQLVALREEALRHARRAAELAGGIERRADVESLARVFTGFDEYDEALKLLQALREDSRFEAHWVSLLLAQVHHANGDVESAREIVEALRDDQASEPVAYVQMGELYIEWEMFEEAAEVYEQALMAFPRALEIRFKLAYLYLALDRPRRALAVLAILKNPPPEGHYLFAHVYRRMGKNNLALRALRSAEAEAVKRNRIDFLGVEFRLFYASLCEDIGFTGETIEQARLAFELAPDDPVCQNFLGYVLADHGRDLPYAEELILKAVAADPENVAYLDSLAWVYFRQERFDEALIEMHKTLELAGDDEDAVILDHAGDIYAANELMLLAAHYWRLALVSEPLHPDEIRAKLREQVDE